MLFILEKDWTTSKLLCVKWSKLFISICRWLRDSDPKPMNIHGTGEDIHILWFLSQSLQLKLGTFFRHMVLKEKIKLTEQQGLSRVRQASTHSKHVQEAWVKNLLFSNKFFYELPFKEIAAGRYYNTCQIQ